jgi:hypothetical protein
LPDKAPDPVASVILLKLAEEPVVMPMASDGKKITASSENPGHPAINVVDGTAHGIWESANTTGVSYLEFDMETPTWIHAVGLDEPDRWPRYRQNIRMEVKTENGWQKLFSVKTRGHGLVRKFDPIQVQRVRLYVDRAEGVPGIAEWQIYAPE